MNLKKLLTPKDTEEIKPGLFIQKRKNNYRQITPLVWKGKYKFRGHFKLKSLIMIILVLFLVWNYNYETKWCREFQRDPCDILTNVTIYCHEKRMSENERGDPPSVQDNP